MDSFRLVPISCVKTSPSSASIRQRARTARLKERIYVFFVQEGRKAFGRGRPNSLTIFFRSVEKLSACPFDLFIRKLGSTQWTVLVFGPCQCPRVWVMWSCWSGTEVTLSTVVGGVERFMHRRMAMSGQPRLPRYTDL